MHTAGSPAVGIRTEIRSGLSALAEDWDAIVDLQTLPSPFLRSWWIDNAAPNAPTVICVFRDDELIGGAAFEVDQWGPSILRIDKVRVVGSGLLAPDHIDLIAAPGHRHDVARAILGWLMHPGDRLVELDGLAAEGTLARLLADDTTSVFGAPLAVLPNDFAEYLAGRPGKVRSTIKRRSRQLSAQGVTHSVATISELDRSMKVFSDLHDMRWGDESAFLKAFHRFESTIRAAAQKGEAIINELRLESGETIAIEIDFRIKNRLFFYQAGRRTEREWHGCGTVLRAHIIESAIRDGVVEYDMLRGDDPYKAEWATTTRKLSSHRLIIGARTTIARAARHRIRHIQGRLG